VAPSVGHGRRMLDMQTYSIRRFQVPLETDRGASRALRLEPHPSSRRSAAGVLLSGRRGKAAIAMPIFYGAGRVAAAIELTVGDLGSELKPAASALSVACRSLSRQLATEFRVRGSRNGHTTRSPEPALDPHYQPT
jgi:hypothetical protein